MIEQLNTIADAWWGWMWPMSWQVGVLITLIAAVDLLIRKRVWPQLRYALWLLVLVKLVLPPTFSLSTSLTSPLQALVEQATTRHAYNSEIATVSNFERDLVMEKPLAETSTEPVITLQGTEKADATGPSGEATVVDITPSVAMVKPSWQVYMMLVWLLGVVTLATWLMVRFRQLRITHRGKIDEANLPAWLEELLTETAKKLNLKRLPEVILSQSVTCPAVFGIFRPVLLLPKKNMTQVSRKDTEHILLHELAHIKRGDLWAHGIYMVLQLVYWFNPLLWLVRRKLQHLRELCCDATVAAILQEKTADYRETILQTAKWLLNKPKISGIGILGLVEGPSRLLIRLNWLEKKTWRYQKMKNLSVITVAVLMITFVLPMAKAQKPKKIETASNIERDQKSIKLLHQAAAAGDVDGVKELITKGADVNSKDEIGQTPLHLAARYGHSSVVERLLASSANIHAQDLYGRMALHYAAEYDRTDVAELLLDKGANVNAKSSRGWTALHCVAEYCWDNLNMAQLLVAKGADLNVEDNYSATPLDMARWNGVGSLVEFLVAKGAKIDAQEQTDSWKPIHTAARYGEKDKVQLLIDQGADVNAKDAEGYTSLHYAAENGHKEVAELLIAQGADVNAKDAQGWRPLHRAAHGGHRDVAELLLDKGADVNAKNKWGGTPLRSAVPAGHKAVVELLVAGGADVNARFGDDYTALHYACGRRGHTNIVEFLIAKGADINARAAGGGTPLHRATRYGRGDLGKLLIERGADANVRNSGGLTPLHYAAMSHLNELAKLLIAKNAEINAKDSSGMTALHYASANNQKDIVEILIANGADLNAEEVVGATPLHKAAERGQKDTAEKLLAKGANINAKDYWGSTPLHVAAGEGHKELAELLIAHGAEINAKNQHGESPLFLAKEEGHTEIVELLLKHGAKE